MRKALPRLAMNHHHRRNLKVEERAGLAAVGVAGYDALFGLGALGGAGEIAFVGCCAVLVGLDLFQRSVCEMRRKGAKGREGRTYEVAIEEVIADADDFKEILEHEFRAFRLSKPTLISREAREKGKEQPPTLAR